MTTKYMDDRRPINRDDPPPRMGNLDDIPVDEEPFPVPPAAGAEIVPDWPRIGDVPRRRYNRDIPVPVMGDLDDEPDVDQPADGIFDILANDFNPDAPFPIPPAGDPVGPEWQAVEFPTQPTEEQIEDLLLRDGAYRRNRMPIEVCTDMQEVREAYYAGMLPGWKDLTVYDVINLEDVTLPAYIAEDKDNLVFVVFNNDRSVRLTFPSTRNAVEQTFPLYECEDDNSMDRSFIPLNQIGAPFGGVCDYHMTKRIVVDTNYQVFFLREQAEDRCFMSEMEPKSAPLESHGVKYWGLDATSDAHCQDGSQRTIYQIHVPAFYY